MFVHQGAHRRAALVRGDRLGCLRIGVIGLKFLSLGFKRSYGDFRPEADVQRLPEDGVGVLFKERGELIIRSGVSGRCEFIASMTNTDKLGFSR